MEGDISHSPQAPNAGNMNDRRKNLEVNEKWKQALNEEARYREEMSNEIIAFLQEKEKGITFEKAEKILSDTIAVLSRMSKRREI